METASIPSWDEYLAAATRLAGGGYVVEWDLSFASEVELRAHYEEIVATVDDADKAHVWTQLESGNRLIWPGSTAQDITYCVSTTHFDSGTYARAVEDMAAATSEWEALANVNFREVTGGNDGCVYPEANVDLFVGALVSDEHNGCAQPPFLNWDWNQPTPPSYSSLCPAPGILLINYSQADLTTGQSQYITARGVFRHELGHVLGFRHEHPWFGGPVTGICAQEGPINGPSGGVQAIEGSAYAYDFESVMHYPQGRCSVGPANDYQFSPMDGMSARAIYGMPVSWYVAAGVI